MQIESVGILISMYPFSERDMIAHIFTKDAGVWVGVLRGAVIAKKNKPLVGQFGAVSWNARLDSQLGTFHWESEKNLSAPLMQDNNLLKLMNSAFALITTLIPERESYERLYIDTLQLLKDLAMSDSPNDIYLKWEIDLLTELGYALDLSKCSGCKCQNNLRYVSPKTGRAVCADCGKPYHDKLYKLPLSLDITGHFISDICQTQGVEIPLARKML